MISTIEKIKIANSILHSNIEFSKKYNITIYDYYSQMLSTSDNYDELIEYMRRIVTIKNIIFASETIPVVIKKCIESGNDKEIKSFDTIISELIDIYKYSEIACKIK